MKKRKSPAPQDEESEMEVDDEEKAEQGEENSDDKEEPVGNDETLEERNPGDDNSFLDSFYGLSSPDPTERAQAANALLHHCLLGPDANLKDASYTFRRLLNGICSGRAGARQGNASALATFLKLSYEGGQLEMIRNEEGEKKNGEESTLSYVRHRLLKATDPSETQGKKKGSEERDYQFGRLFGILSVVRSGILLPDDKGGSDLDDIIHVASGLVADLVGLYNLKKWMKEPAAHAIGTLLNAFYTICNTEGGRKAISHLVDEVVVPKVLLDESGNFAIKDYCAEQIAIAVNIQSHSSSHPKGLSAPLNEPIFSPETIPVIAQSLAATSSVVQPRTHLVWDSIWLYLTEEDSGSSKEDSAKSPRPRKLRKEPPLGSYSVQDTVESLLRHAVVEGLLKGDSYEGHVTNERRALALCIIRNLLGVEFNSSISGLIKLKMEADDLENIVLTPLLIKRLFLDVICGGKAHLLKPLALSILEAVVDCLVEISSDVDDNRRAAVAICFVRCEPRFDSLTKTTTVADLVGLSDTGVGDYGSNLLKIWGKYLDCLEQGLVSSMESRTELNDKFPGYADALYNAAKRFLRLEIATESEMDEVWKFRGKAVKKIVCLFMASSFFDCSGVPNDNVPKSTNKKKKKKTQSQDVTPLTEAAIRLNNLRTKCGGNIACMLPYNARLLLSERFFSLLGEEVNTSIHSVNQQNEGRIHAKDTIMLNVLMDLCNGWQSLEVNGGKPLFSTAGNNEEGKVEATASPGSILAQLQSLASDLSHQKELNDAKSRARKRCATGCAALASALSLHLLGCGRPDDVVDEENITTEDDDDNADIIDALEGIGDITPILIKGTLEEGKLNPLGDFAELCIDVLSSNICSGNPSRGASPKLIREAVKYAWGGALAASAHIEHDATLLDSHVVSVLLNSIGVSDDLQGSEQHDSDDDDAGSQDYENDDESSDDSVEGDFSRIGNILGEDAAEMDEGSEEGSATADRVKVEGGNQDIEIDSNKLNSLLEEDSDADVDVGELEHHEGADAALAMLIKMKQEARKASRQAREKLEIAKRIRCTVLIETLLSKSDGWDALLRRDIVLQLILPMIKYRNQMEKSLLRTSGKVNKSDGREKADLLDRLTHLLKSKAFKLKLAHVPASKSCDIIDFCCKQASEMMEMARKSSSKEQMSCCSSALNMLLKAVPGVDGVLKVASVYVPAVEEWSTKRTSRLEAHLFDDLINHYPSVAQATLIGPLASGSTSARSPFLRCESLRLLALLYNPKLNSQASDVDRHALEKAEQLGPTVIASITKSLRDEDMQKAKRVREILKTIEKVLLFAKSRSSSFSNLNDLCKAMQELDSKLGNQAIHKVIEKLTSSIEMLVSGSNNDNNKDDEEMEDADVDNTRADKKSKKKKKKKKKGKK